MKKLLAVLLVGLLVLTGCSKTDTPDTDETGGNLVIYGLDGGYGSEGWEAVVKAFEEETGIEVELVLEQNIAEELMPKLQAEEDIDLIYLAVGSEGGVTDTLIAEEALVQLDDLLSMKIPGEDSTVKDKVIDGFFDSNRVRPYEDGNLYLTPHFYSPLGMFYNKGLFEDHGWELPNTWDEFFELAEAAKAEGIAAFTYPTAGYFDGFFASLLNSVAGPELYNAMMAYDLDAWESDEAKEAFELVGRIAEYTHENTVAQANGEGFQKNQLLVMENNALFVPNGTWLPGEMADAVADEANDQVGGADVADNFAWGLAPIPAGASGDRYSSTFTEEAYIPSVAKNVDNAKAFLAFMYSDKAAQLFYENGGAVQPILSDIIPEGDDNNIYYNIYNDGVKSNTVGFAATEPVEGVVLGDVLYENVNLVVNGELSVDAWYAEVLDAIAKFN